MIHHMYYRLISFCSLKIKNIKCNYYWIFCNIKQRKRISMQKLLLVAAAEGSIPGTSPLFKHPKLPLCNQHFICVHSLAWMGATTTENERTPNYYYPFPFPLADQIHTPNKISLFWLRTAKPQINTSFCSGTLHSQSHPLSACSTTI